MVPISARVVADPVRGQHFDAYVEGKGKRQQDGSIGRDDWRPLHSKVGDELYVVNFGRYRLEVGPSRKASAQLLIATLEAADER
jgi:hypothetical protein